MKLERSIILISNKYVYKHVFWMSQDFYWK